MKRNQIKHGLMMLSVAVLAVPAFAQHEGHEQGEKGGQAEMPLCPVTDNPVNFTANTMTMTDEGPVYFCCPKCIDKFKENKEQYAQKAAAQREQLKKLERVQVSCPVTGKPIDKKVSAEVNGKTVYFCCAGCKPKYEADPAKYEDKLEASYTYQTKCPVMGNTINPAAYVDLPTGERIYFCCPGCDKKFVAEPAKYAENLEKQGVRLDIKKLEQDAAKSDGKMHGGDDHAGHGHQ